MKHGRLSTDELEQMLRDVQTPSFIKNMAEEILEYRQPSIQKNTAEDEAKRLSDKQREHMIAQLKREDETDQEYKKRVSEYLSQNH